VLPSHHEESTNRKGKNVDHTYAVDCIEYPFV